MARTTDITELVLRDAHQTLMAPRMTLEDMAPAREAPDKADTARLVGMAAALVALGVHAGDARKANRVVVELE